MSLHVCYEGLDLHGASLHGVQLLKDQLLLWHSEGLLRYHLPCGAQVGLVSLIASWVFDLGRITLLVGWVVLLMLGSLR